MDVKFHPTMPDHVVVLSTMTISEQPKINTLVPMELIKDMDKEIKKDYLNQAKNLFMTQNRGANKSVPNMPDSFSDESLMEDGGQPSSYKSSSNPSGDTSSYSEEEDESDESQNEDPSSSTYTNSFVPSEDSMKPGPHVDEVEQSKEQYFSELGDNLKNIRQTKMENEELDYDYPDNDETKKQKKVRIHEERELFADLASNPNRMRETVKRNEPRMIQNDVHETKFMRKKTMLKKISKPMKDSKAIYDKALQMYLKENYTLFEYQGLDPQLLKANLEDDYDSDDSSMHRRPDDRSKLRTNDFNSPESDGQTFSRCKGWNGEMYVPPVFKERYQLSLWKIDNFGVVKISNMYFTPKAEKAVDKNFVGFRLKLSMDEQTMLMIEKKDGKQKSLLVISFDVYNLTIISETSVPVADDSIRNEPYYQGLASELDILYRGPYRVSDQVPRVTSWNFGDYLMTGISTICKSNIIYKYNIYNTKTTTLMNTIDRTSNELLENQIIAIFDEEENEDWLNFATLNEEDIVMLQVNILSSEVEEVATYTGFNPVSIFPSANNATLFIIHLDTETKLYSLY